MIQDKVYIALTDALPLVKQWKEAGHQIVFTNGCYDLIHIGHVLYLEEARSLGDKLIVGVNSDASVRRLKGKSRPIKDEYNRLHIMAALESVDMVILFNEDTPIMMIKAIMPDVLVKGGDWQPDQIVGSDVVLAIGGQVKSLTFVEGYSTTALEQKIKNE
ncbi:MAG: D-glycero-beta-D-manno-heptose 1-phosphate adenylyltransferase [Saprospiraceae bacterium]